MLINQVVAQDLRIQISSGQVEPIPIAIAGFTGKDSKANEIEGKISEVGWNEEEGGGGLVV